MENPTAIKSEDFNSLSVGKLVEASVISPILSINSFFWTEVLEGFNMLKVRFVCDKYVRWYSNKLSGKYTKMLLYQYYYTHIKIEAKY